MAQNAPKKGSRWPKSAPRWPQEGSKIAQGNPKMVQWGGLPLRSAAPCLQVVLRAEVWTKVQRTLPLWGNVVFPKPPDRRRVRRRSSPLSGEMLTFMINAHHSHAVCPLLQITSTNDCRTQTSKLVKKPRFYQSNSSKHALEFKMKNIKMKLSLESGGIFMKTASS